jgi:SET domain-containing protein
MLLATTSVAPSTIAGIGLFAAEPVSAGQLIRRFEPKFDPLLDIADMRAVPVAFHAFVEMYRVEAHAFGGRCRLLRDHAKSINHSENPSLASEQHTSHALCGLAVGDEITSDYRAGLATSPGFGALAQPI